MAVWLAAFGCVSPPLPVDLDSWHEVRLPRVALLGNVEPEALRELASELALFHALILRITDARVERSTVPVRLYVFRDPAEAKPFTDWAAGMMLRSLSDYSGYLSDDGAFYRTRRVLFHEYVHAVLRSGRRLPYPRWYDEGMSEFLASTRFREDTAIVGATLSGRVGFLSREGVFPLESLFGADVYPWREIHRFYATSWALVHLLNGTEDGRNRLARFTRRLAQGDAWRDAYDASFDRDLQALEAELEKHVAQLALGSALDFYLPLQALEGTPVPEAEPVAAGEIAYQLSAAARWRFEHAEEDPERFLRLMRALLERSLSSDPSNARARAALAWAYAQDGDEERASTALARAQAEAPDDAVVALEAGRMQMLRAAASGLPPEAAAARTALERAVRLDPELPDAHAEYGRLLRVMGEPVLAIASLGRARELGAWSPDLDLDLARAHLATGSYERAVELLVPVAADPHAGESARRARRLLAEVERRTVVDPETGERSVSPRRPTR